jgi:hypothetical protein
MKKVVLSLLATVATGMSVQTASAFGWPWQLVKVSPHNYNCDAGSGYCMQSANPDDPSANVGDEVLINYPDGSVGVGTIVSINSDPKDDSHPLHVDIVNATTKEVDHIATSGR